MGNADPEPYRALGAKLKFLREQWNQSLGEVSGTLEIEETALKAIEEGATFPGDELLEMLISHFLLTEEQAKELRDMSRQEQQIGIDALSGGIEEALMKQILLMLPDNRVVYTDSMQATVNSAGVVMEFHQQNKADGDQVTVSRVGMSREHAEKIIEVLNRTLSEHDRRQHSRLISDNNTNS